MQIRQLKTLLLATSFVGAASDQSENDTTSGNKSENENVSILETMF